MRILRSLTGRQTGFYYAPDNGAGSGVAGDAGKQGDDKPPLEKTFTQDAVNRIVTERLAKESAKYQKQIEEMGLSLAEIEDFKAHKAAKVQAEEDKKKADGKWQEILKDSQAKTAKEIADAKAEAATMKAKFENTAIENSIMSIGAANHGIKLKQVATLTRSFFRVNDKDIIEVVDAAGDAILDNKGAPFTPETFLTDWLQKNDHFLESKGGGSGSYKGGGSSAGRIYTREELKDTKFYEANKADILKAHKEGRIKQ